jgi:hypothetical protein
LEIASPWIKNGKTTNSASIALVVLLAFVLLPRLALIAVGRRLCWFGWGRWSVGCDERLRRGQLADLEVDLLHGEKRVCHQEGLQGLPRLDDGGDAMVVLVETLEKGEI